MCSQSTEHERCDKFAVISFPDEEDILCIVASSWLEKTQESNFHSCSWPPYKGDTRIKVAVLENEIPASTWNKYNVRLIKKCCTYESAEEILETIKIICAHQAEILHLKKCKHEQIEFFQRRLKETTSLSSEISSNFSSNGCSPSHSGPFMSTLNENIDESFLDNSLSRISVESNRGNSLDAQTESFSENVPRLSVLSSTSNVEILKKENIKSSFEIEVLKNLKDIKEQQYQNSNQLNKFSKQLSKLTDTIFALKEIISLASNDTFKEVFPFSSVEDLQQFDLKLKDQNLKNHLIRHFSKIGGASVVNCTGNLLKFIMKPSVAVEYTYYGTKHGKKPFSRLEILDVIRETVRMHFENATDAEIAKISQTWFRHAKEKLEKLTMTSPQEKNDLSI